MSLPNPVNLLTDSKPQTNYKKTSVCLSPKITLANQQKMFFPPCSCAQPRWPGLSISASPDALPPGMVLSTKSPSGRLCSMRTTILALPPLMTATSTTIH